MNTEKAATNKLFDEDWPEEHHYWDSYVKNSEQAIVQGNLDQKAGEADDDWPEEDEWSRYEHNSEHAIAQEANEDAGEEGDNEPEDTKPLDKDDWDRDEEDNWSYDDDQPDNVFQREYLVSPLGAESRGNRITMPASALEQLMASNVQFPMVFEITNPSAAAAANKVSHCGVLEFSSEEGSVMLPPGMMENLQLEKGQLVSLKSTSLPQGTFMKIQPHATEFIELSNPRDVLERALRHFSCVTCGDTVMINHGDKKYYINILETKPANAISLVDTDCEVDFAPPLDFKEPQKKPAVSVKAAAVQEEPKFRAFSGVSRRLDGQQLTASATVDTIQASTSSKVDKKETSTKHDQPKFQPFTGKKYTLAG